MIKAIVVFMIFVLGATECIAQERVLMLQTRNRNRNVYYRLGDNISFRVEGGNKKVSGEILDLKDDAIVFSNLEVPVRDITSLYKDGKTRWWLRFKIEQIGLMAGGAYMLLELINTGQVSKETLIVGGSLVGVGLLAKLLIGNQIKIKGRTRLRVLKF
jgi:hypothetical protein